LAVSKPIIQKIIPKNEKMYKRKCQAQQEWGGGRAPYAPKVLAAPKRFCATPNAGESPRNAPLPQAAISPGRLLPRKGQFRAAV
jgi:hypothetical protein